MQVCADVFKGCILINLTVIVRSHRNITQNLLLTLSFIAKMRFINNFQNQVELQLPFHLRSKDCEQFGGSTEN